MADHSEPAADPASKPAEGAAHAPRKAFGPTRPAAGVPVPVAPTEARPDLEGRLADLMDSVKGLQSHLAGGQPVSTVAPVTPEPRVRGPKRFQRRAGEELAEPETPRETPREPVLDHEVRGNEATLNKNIAWPRVSRPEPESAPAGERGLNFVQRHPFVLWVVVQAAGLGLILLGYWVGSSLSGDDEDRGAKGQDRAVAGTKAPGSDLLARVGVNDRAMAVADTGMRAEKAGDIDAARRAYEEAAASHIPLPGTEYRLAMLDIERGEMESADIHLNNSLAAGEMLAPCYFVNSWYASRKTDYPNAAKQLAHASRLEPFNAKYLFCYGEALRRAGRAQAAIDALSQALDRPGAPPDLELVEFKQRLAKVELGQDEAFNKELADHLARRPIGGDWLMLGAAQNLVHGEYPAAASRLADAARLLSPHAFSVLVQDYLYQGYANRAEIAPVLKVSAPLPSAKPLDFAAWPFSEADPATWPPFAPAL